VKLPHAQAVLGEVLAGHIVITSQATVLAHRLKPFSWLRVIEAKLLRIFVTKITLLHGVTAHPVRMHLYKYTAFQNGKQTIEVQAFFLNPFIVCSSDIRKFIVCPFVDKKKQMDVIRLRTD
jgi:hypothetical protein